MVPDKGVALLNFLKATTAIRRKRISSYGPADKVLWFADIPRKHPDCRSPFLTEKMDDLGGTWLEVRKKQMPVRPPVPQVVADWVRVDDLDQPDKEPELRPEISVIVKREVPDTSVSRGVEKTILDEMSEVHRLADHPEVKAAWRKYLVKKWKPWASELQQWRAVQTVYESLDVMRRRIEEAEELYELVLAIGFLQWRDPTGTSVARHVLTAPAELTLDAARGLLAVVPAASFDGFRIELDMLDPLHQPLLNRDKLDGLLEELDIQAWDVALVVPILHEIANSLSADAQVDETHDRVERTEDRPRLAFAPALVLRERRPTAYEDLIRRFLEAATGNTLETTCPWNRLLQEGEAPSSGTDNPTVDPEETAADLVLTNRFLFPLPSNEEQRKIVQRLEADPCVLVKGPPGTGKSHTIANLICHLLANGDRILVTAQTPKALEVLRSLLPSDIRDLCVTALGSSREEQRLLEESVRGILRRKNEWRGGNTAQREIEKTEGELRELENNLARVELELRTFREAETYTHELPGGYSGTAAQIARMVHEQKQEFGWFPELSPDAVFPLDPSEIAFLAQAHANFTATTRAELELEIGVAELPSPDEFQALVARLIAAEERAQRSSREVDEAKLEFLEPIGTEQLSELRQAVMALTELMLRVARTLGEASGTILLDLLASADNRWTRLAKDSEALLAEAKRLLVAIGSARVELPDRIAENHLRTDVELRLAHFEAGGRKGFFFFAPRVVRETRYIVDDCRVDGKRVTQLDQLRCIRDYLALQLKIRQLQDIWGDCLAEASIPMQAVSRTEELTAALNELLAFFKSERADTLATVLGAHRLALASASGRNDWLKVIDALLADREVRDAQHELGRLLETIRGSKHDLKAHPCLSHLEEAVQARDVAAWRTAIQERERIRLEKQLLARYDALLKRLDGACPGLGELLHNTGGDASWQNRVCKLQEAWHWAAARAWLQRFSDARAYKTREQHYRRLKQKIENTTEKLVSLRAWKAFFDRLDEKTIQSLKAWTRAVDRIGKGTGKHANSHRRTARRYLMDCVPRIPAWIMPLHRLWDSVDAEPGLFDTIIVDEASQAGIDSLALLLLAKRIVVVGDDKQNSPEAVGVLEDDIKRFAREYLSAFRFRDEFRPDTSLFDHAERTFWSVVMLREHFRCVPEIIRFSNDLCYRDAPLIPLRQAPLKRLQPLRSFFVGNGTCEGVGQRIRNRAEAEALVETIVKLVDDEAYKGKTMGVIALQGHAQAQFIETLLAQKLHPKVIEERRLRCGEPTTFQGDQRDVIFLSLVIAPNVHYRALTRLPDQRRFNVAMSRARDQVWLFHSVKPHDLAPDDLRRRLVSFFETPQKAAVHALLEDLDRLEREARRHRQRGNQPAPYESWFEVDVALELLRRKLCVRPQVDVAGYRIDLVVEGVDARLAVECDGDDWHGPEQYEYDMARQRQLERVGWTFVRVRASDFYLDRQRAVNAVVEACEELGIHPVDFVDEGQRDWLRPHAPNAGSSISVLEKTKDSGEDTKQSVAETEASFSMVEPLTGYTEASWFPDPRMASEANLREVLRRIIEQNGPLKRSTVHRLYIETCPGPQRVGKTVREALDKALGIMLQTGEIVQEDELGDGSPEGLVVRIAGAPAVNVRSAGRRDLLEIPPSELVAVLRHSQSSLKTNPTDEDLFRVLLDHYGYKRLTAPRRQYLQRVIRLFRGNGGT